MSSLFLHEDLWTISQVSSINPFQFCFKNKKSLMGAFGFLVNLFGLCQIVGRPQSILDLASTFECCSFFFFNLFIHLHVQGQIVMQILWNHYSVNAGNTLPLHTCTHNLHKRCQEKYHPTKKKKKKKVFSHIFKTRVFISFKKWLLHKSEAQASRITR